MTFIFRSLTIDRRYAHASAVRQKFCGCKVYKFGRFEERTKLFWKQSSLDRIALNRQLLRLKIVTIENFQDKKIDDCSKTWTRQSKLTTIIRRHLTEVLNASAN